MFESGLAGPELDEVETRYARPHLPVNPLDTTAEVGQRSVAQRPQRNKEF